MLLNRAKIIALCAGGWVLVTAAYMACILQLPTTDAGTKCKTVATNATWVNRVGSIVVDITDPRWCPVIIDGPPGTAGFQNYSANVQLNAAAVSPSMPRMDYTFANANNVVQSTEIKFFTIGSTVAVTTATGAYQVGTAGNVATKRDYVHNIIYTTSGPATGDGWLDYDYHANPTISGPTSQPDPTIRMTANTPRIQQPATYQWFIGSVAQGPRSGSPNYYQTFSKVVTAVGGYTVKAVIIDKWNRSYTVSRTVQVTAVGCGGKICR